MNENQSSGRAWRPELSHPVGVVLLLPALALFALLFFVPLFQVVVLSVTDPIVGLDRYRDFFGNQAMLRATLTTLWTSAIVTVVALALGLFVAWTLRSTQSRTLRALLWIGTIFPLWMSVVVLTYVFTIILQRRGIVNETLQFVGIIGEPADLLYNPIAVIVAMVYSLTPLAILPLYGTLINIDLDLVRAAQSLGASRLRAIGGIVLPLALPALLVAGTLVFVIAIGFYITPTLLGSPTRPFLAAMLADQVYTQYDAAGAAAGSTILLVLTLVITGAAYLAVGRDRIRSAFA